MADDVDVKTRVDRELYERFLNLFPQRGSLTWFVGEAMRAMVETMEKDPEPKDRIVEAIDRLTGRNRERA